MDRGGSPLNYLVYGTLRRGQRANGIINRGTTTYVGTGRITTPCRIANLGGFPAICPSLMGHHQPVVDVYNVEDEDIKNALDHYEGFPRLYTKRNMFVNIDGEDIEGVVYVMEDPNDTSQSPELPDGDWMEVVNA